jgi:hypothetical protein
MNRLIVSAIVLMMFGAISNATEVIKEGKEYPLDKLREQNKKIIKMVVEEISKNLPQKVDKYTQITNIRDENLTLIYTFEINTGVKSDEAVKKEDELRMKKNITKGVCQSSKRFLDSGVTLTYKYMSASTKKELFTFTMTQKLCSELKDD